MARMNQISLRQFRERIGDLREPVEVSRRDVQGNIQILGYWTPYMTDAPASGQLDLDAVIAKPVAVASPVRAFPKAVQAGKKR
jgi:hypothetical protein